MDYGQTGSDSRRPESIYIRPNPYNEHVLFHNFMQRVRSIPGELKGAKHFLRGGCGVSEGGDPRDGAHDASGRSRETYDGQAEQVAAPYIKNGTVLIPLTGCEQLLGRYSILAWNRTTTCVTA